MVIGDSENDYSMLGLPYIESIAMGNADDIIQEICLHHTADNDHDGNYDQVEQILSQTMIIEHILKQFECFIYSNCDTIKMRRNYTQYRRLSHD